jgi:hypothetical protein
MKGEHDVAWLTPALKVLTAHGEAARESAKMKGERDVLWLAPAFAVLSPSKCSPSIVSPRALKVLAKEKRTAKRHTKARKST